MGLGVISLAKSIRSDITESIVNVHKSAVRLRVLSYDSVHIFFWLVQHDCMECESLNYTRIKDHTIINFKTVLLRDTL